MRLLVVGHAYAAPINREKWQTFARLYPHAQVTVLSPQMWNDVLGTVAVDGGVNGTLPHCRFVSLKTVRTGNEVLYGYRVRDLVHLLRQVRPEVIHVEQGDQAWSYAQIQVLARLVGLRPKITFFTWVNWKEKRSWRYRLLWRWIEWLNLGGSHGAFVGNADAGILLREKGFKKPLCVLPQLGVDLHFFAPAPQRVEGPRYVACIGRLVVEKGVLTLLDAFAQVADRYPTWKLRFVGRGTGVAELQNRIQRYGLVNRVEIRDSVSHEAVRDLLHETDVVVLPSHDVPTWKEQFGHILIEAMACGVPVIGSDGGEIPNVIGHAGKICRQRDVEDLARCLEYFMASESERIAYAQKGLARVAEQYSHEAIARKTYNFLSSL